MEASRTTCPTSLRPSCSVKQKSAQHCSSSIAQRSRSSARRGSSLRRLTCGHHRRGRPERLSAECLRSRRGGALGTICFELSVRPSCLCNLGRRPASCCNFSRIICRFLRCPLLLVLAHLYQLSNFSSVSDFDFSYCLDSCSASKHRMVADSRLRVLMEPFPKDRQPDSSGLFSFCLSSSNSVHLLADYDA